MPYAWTHDSGAAPAAHLRLWPHRSLPRKGFAAFILATFAMITIPLYPLLGTVVLWGLLPFLLLAVAGLWWGLERSYRDARMSEELHIDSANVHLLRNQSRRRATGMGMPELLGSAADSCKRRAGRALHHPCAARAARSSLARSCRKMSANCCMVRLWRHCAGPTCPIPARRDTGGSAQPCLYLRADRAEIHLPGILVLEMTHDLAHVADRTGADLGDG